MQIDNNTALFDAVRQIINELNEAQQTDAAKQLKEALSFSSMPTEILGETRVAAQVILKQSNNDLINKKLERVIQYIDNAFGNKS